MSATIHSNVLTLTPGNINPANGQAGTWQIAWYQAPTYMDNQQPVPFPDGSQRFFSCVSSNMTLSVPTEQVRRSRRSTLSLEVELSNQQTLFGWLSRATVKLDPRNVTLRPFGAEILLPVKGEDGHRLQDRIDGRSVRLDASINLTLAV